MKLGLEARARRVVTVEVIPDRVTRDDLSSLKNRVDAVTIPALRNGHRDASYPADFNISPQHRSLSSAVVAKKTGIETIPTLTCRDARPADVNWLVTLVSRGIDNFLVVYGDPFDDVRDWYEFSKSEHLIRRIAETLDSHAPSIGAVTNQYSRDRESEVERTLAKVDAGADFVLTNISFEKDGLLAHRDALLAAGLDVPLFLQVSIPHSLDNLLYVSQKFSIPVQGDVMRRLANGGVLGGVELAGEAFDGLEHEADGVHFSYLLRSKSPIRAYESLLDRIGRPSRILVPPQIAIPNSA